MLSTIITSTMFDHKKNKIPLRINKNIIKSFASFFVTRPDARGLFFFLGCSLSASISL